MRSVAPWLNRYKFQLRDIKCYEHIDSVYLVMCWFWLDLCKSTCWATPCKEKRICSGNEKFISLQIGRKRSLGAAFPFSSSSSSWRHNFASIDNIKKWTLLKKFRATIQPLYLWKKSVCSWRKIGQIHAPARRAATAHHFVIPIKYHDWNETNKKTKKIKHELCWKNCAPRFARSIYSIITTWRVHLPR